MDYFAQIADQRRAVADVLETLDDDQWRVQSLCGEWDVRNVAAHLTMGWNVSLPKFAFAMLKNRGDFNKASVGLTANLAKRPTAAIIADLRENADDRFTPPGGDSTAPLSDVIIHSQDMFRPLGIDHRVDVEVVLPALERSTDKKTQRIRGTDIETRFDLRATDSEWTWTGSGGPELRGPSLSLLLALFGRTAAHSDLDGPIDLI